MTASIWHRYCLQSFKMNSKRTYHMNICATFLRYSIDITHPFFSQCFIMSKRFSSALTFGLSWTIFCQWIKKSRTISLIYKDNMLLHMLPIALKKTESTKLFHHFQKRDFIFKSSSFLNGFSHRDGIGPK